LLGSGGQLFDKSTLGSYGAVGWGCHDVQAKMQKEKKFRHQVDHLADDICQQKDLTASMLLKVI
jgi:hypothetical protein